MSYLVSVIIPTWNLRNDCIACLESVLMLNYPKNLLEVIVVDNASCDGSATEIKKRFPAVRVLKLSKNWGYAGGINRGVKVSSGKYILILNNDTILDKNMLKNLLEVLSKSSKIGAVGPKVYFFDRPKEIEKVWGEIDQETMNLKNVGRGELDRGQYNQLRDVDALVFVGLLVRREVFNSIGKLDERYFMLYEDVDFFLRVKEAGYRMIYVPKAMIWHKGSLSIKKIKSDLPYYLVRNQLLTIAKHGRMTIFNHIKNVRFMLSSFLIAIFSTKQRKHFLLLAFGVFDFYRGQYGRREVR